MLVAPFSLCFPKSGSPFKAILYSLDTLSLGVRLPRTLLAPQNYVTGSWTICHYSIIILIIKMYIMGIIQLRFQALRIFPTDPTPREHASRVTQEWGLIIPRYSLLIFAAIFVIYLNWRNTNYDNDWVFSRGTGTWAMNIRTDEVWCSIAIINVLYMYMC